MGVSKGCSFSCRQSRRVSFVIESENNSLKKSCEDRWGRYLTNFTCPFGDCLPQQAENHQRKRALEFNNCDGPIGPSHFQKDHVGFGMVFSFAKELHCASFASFANDAAPKVARLMGAESVYWPDLL